MELTDEYWPENVRNTAQVVFEIEEGVDPFSEENIRVLYDFSKEILEIEHTSYVYTYAHFNFSMSQDEVVAFWDTSEDQNLTSEQAYVLNLQRSYHTENSVGDNVVLLICLLYTSPSPRDGLLSRMPSSA